MKLVECIICGKMFDYDATDNVCICDECAEEPEEKE